MSSSTALLPKDRKKDDHPIFLRVTHSPWSFIGQKALVGLRAMTATYMVGSLVMMIDYELNRNGHGFSMLFEFSNLSMFLSTLYHTIAATWTYMHLAYPHHGSQIPSTATRLQKALSPPRQNPNTNNRTWFSIFQTAATTLPHVANFMYWAVLTPKGRAEVPLGMTVGHGWFTTFFVFHKYAVTSFIALLEVLVYSSIKRQTPLSAHYAGIASLMVMATAWQYVGYVATDRFEYWFLDHKQVGWEYTTSSWIGLVALAMAAMSGIYGLTALREFLTKKADNKGSYQQLPQ